MALSVCVYPVAVDAVACSHCNKPLQQAKTFLHQKGVAKHIHFAYDHG